MRIKQLGFAPRTSIECPKEGATLRTKRSDDSIPAGRTTGLISITTAQDITHRCCSVSLLRIPFEFGANDTNLYAYVAKDPINSTDPLGLEKEPGFFDNGGPEWFWVAWELAGNGGESDGAGAYYNEASGGLRAAARLARVAGRLARAVGRVGRTARGLGRLGKQAQLRGLARDPKVCSADRGWIRQEMNSIQRKQRTTIRVPPGKEARGSKRLRSAKGLRL